MKNYIVSINEKTEVEAVDKMEAVEKFMEWLNNVGWATLETLVEEID